MTILTSVAKQTALMLASAVILVAVMEGAQAFSIWRQGRGERG